MKTHLPDLHQHILYWKSQVELVRDELSSFNQRLQEVATRNSEPAVLSQVEHFQNQFIRQQEISDELFHHLRLADEDLAQQAASNPAADHLIIEVPADLKDQADTYSRIFQELKNEFQRFLEKTL